MSIENYLTVETNFQNVFSEKSFREILSEEAFNRFSQEKQLISFNKGKTIFEEGDTPDGVYFINKGTAKLYKHGFNKKEQILRFCKEGDMLGYRSLLCREPLGASAKAMNPMQITFLPGDVFNDLLMTDPTLSYAMLQKIAYELGQSSNTITYLAQKTVRERLAEVLLLLETKLGSDGEGFINISLTRGEIANLIGTATESAIRLISEFKVDELILVEGRNIKILDHEKLRRLGRVMM